MLHNDSQHRPKKIYDFSIIVPFYNEAENIELLYNAISTALAGVSKSFEMIFIDDGSSDDGFAIMERVARKDSRAKLIQFTRNFGQTAAISAGFKAARGKIYIPMDADNQNDPRDIPQLLEKLEEGYDVVSGWRQDRKDAFALRRFPSMIANRLISLVTRVPLKDYGCTLKAYRSEYIDPVTLYGEMHRFIPAYAKLAGAKITEIPVHHHPRTRGVSKYGLSRIFKVLLDLLTIKFLGSFATKPLYLFGGLGMIFCAIAVLCGFEVLYEKYGLDVYAHDNPMLLLAVFLFLLGGLLIMMGLLAELLMRTYHESQGKSIYLVRKEVNL